MTYYSKHAKDYIESTIHADMSKEYQMVERYLQKGDAVLDVGFGSARDMLYFQAKGYRVEGIDSEIEFVNHAKDLGLNVKAGDVRNFSSDKKYKLIWCCASLLHLKREEIYKTIDRLISYLEDDGILFVSMKYSHQEDGIDDKGRYFTYFSDKDISLLPNVIETSIKDDPTRDDVKWVSVVMQVKK